MTVNNVRLANEMTYSRHYPLLENVYEALGRDLNSSVAFFREVDSMKHERETVMMQHRITDDKSVAFVRAYEAAVVQTIATVIRNHAGRVAEGRIK